MTVRLGKAEESVMPKQEIPEKLKRETPDPQAFDKFKAFAKRIAHVRKEDLAKQSKPGSRSTKR